MGERPDYLLSQLEEKEEKTLLFSFKHAPADFLVETGKLKKTRTTTDGRKGKQGKMESTFLELFSEDEGCSGVLQTMRRNV